MANERYNCPWNICCRYKFFRNKIPTTGETILGESYNIGPGGKGCNQAIAISRLGEKVNFISKLGDDDYGKLAIDKLKKDKVDTSNIIISKTQNRSCGHSCR